MGREPLPSKLCPVCGRRFSWRKKWARDWEQVRYCSSQCRRRGVEGTAALESAILRALSQRPRGAVVPLAELSDLIVDIPSSFLQSESLKSALRRLAERGDVDLVDGGRRLDPTAVKGDWRVRRR